MSRLEIPSVTPQDVATLHRWLLEAFRRSGDSFGGQIVLRAAVGTTETKISHGLTERPLAVFWSNDGVVRVGRTRAEDDRFIYLRASTATIVDILVIPGFSRQIAGTIAPLDADVAALDAGVDDAATDPASETVTLRGFRLNDIGGSYTSGTDRIHFPGINNISAASAYIGGATTNTLQNIGTGQMAYAIPETFERAVNIVRLISRNNGAVGSGGSPRIKFGVYANGSLTSGTFSGSPYPSTLLGSSGDLNCDAANALYETSGLSIAIAAGTRVWFVWTCNDAAVTNQYTVPSYRGGTLLPILGFILDPSLPTTIVNDDATRGVGWRHAVTYTGTEALPSTFPQSSPVALLGNDQTIPCVGYGMTYT